MNPTIFFMNNVLVTGKNGFIAKNLIKELESKGYIVTTIDYNNKVVDIKDEIYNLLNKHRFDGVFHVGACSDTLETDANYMMSRNYESTKAYADWCELNDKKFIYSSSAANYGVNNLYPSNLYGWSKYVGEDYTKRTGGIALRYFNVYGEGEEHKKKMASVAYQMFVSDKKNKTILLFPGSPKRDFVYVKDIVDSNIFAYENYEKLRGKHYDVGSGEARTFEEMLNLMNIEYQLTDWPAIPKGYQFYTKADPNKFMPGWSPKYNLELGIESYLKYLNND